MRVSHSFSAISAVFDDPNFMSCVGLAPAMTLGHRAGLAALAENAPILPGADQGCYVDIDDTIKTTHGRKRSN